MMQKWTPIMDANDNVKKMQKWTQILDEKGDAKLDTNFGCMWMGDRIPGQQEEAT